jgi:hypothetical protein
MQRLFCGAEALALLLAVPSLGRTNRIYYIGNSVTDTIRYDGLRQLAESRGHVVPWGRQMIPGAPLEWLWDHPADGFVQPPYGPPTNALPYYPWDTLSLQPFDRLMPSDTNFASLFINLGMPHNADMQVYIYSRWPRQSNFMPDYDGCWLASYNGGWGFQLETRDFFEKVLLGLRSVWSNRLNKTVLMVPVGEAIYNLNQKVKAGRVPGFTSIAQLYADGIHFNDTGAYLVGCVYYSTLFKENPIGLPSAPYNLAAAAPIVGIIQTTAWETVAHHPYSGVVPEPSLALWLGAVFGGGVWRRARNRRMNTA